MKQLGLDPADVKIIVIAHGHADHFGGAPYMQEHYHPQIYMSASDWDYVQLVPPPAQGQPAIPPKVDMVRYRRTADRSRRCKADAGADSGPHARFTGTDLPCQRWKENRHGRNRRRRHGVAKSPDHGLIRRQTQGSTSAKTRGTQSVRCRPGELLQVLGGHVPVCAGLYRSPHVISRIYHVIVPPGGGQRPIN